MIDVWADDFEMPGRECFYCDWVEVHSNSILDYWYVCTKQGASEIIGRHAEPPEWCPLRKGAGG